jgi:uncharacterized iron-regulated membrane protein
MRKWHRWIGTVAGLFLIFVSITGSLLHIDMFISGAAPPGSEPPPKTPQETTASLDAKALGESLVRAITAAKASQPGLHVAHLNLAFKDGGTVITIGGNGPDAPSIRIDGASGQIMLPPPPKPKDYHYVLQDIHAAYFLGWTGRIISTLIGLSLCALGFSGLKLFLEMLSRRKKAGQQGWFWER